MPLFRREKPGSEPSPPAGTGQYPTARIEPGNGDLVLVELLGYAGRADWDAIRGVLGGYSGGDFIELVDQLCHLSPAMDEWLPAVAKDGGGQLAFHGPYGNRLAELVARAHIEQRQSIQEKDAKKAYIRSPAVRQSLVQAADLSIDHPDFARPARAPYYTQNTFAMAFSLAAMQPRAFAAFEATEGVVDGPWTYINGRDPVRAYNVWRDWSRTKF
jgi:hypothetical protein